MAVPTPVTDGKNVYVLFGTADLAALDMDGKPVWIRSLAQEYGEFSNRWGMAASPVLVDGLLLVLVDHFAQSYLLAIDAASGANRWKTDRDATVGWTTPLPVKVGKRTEIIVYGTYRAMAYDAADGDHLWTVTGMHMQCIPSPVAAGGLVVACSGENTMAIQLAGQKGDVTKSHVLWVNEKAKNSVPSPLLYEGLLYLPGDRGVVQCLDVKTGVEVWKKRLGDEYHASPVAGDGKIYFTSKQGTIHVIESGRRFELLAQNYLDEMIVASPAISQGEIFLRGDKHLFCIAE
jgi:outer membrane protein assembly factor BamB